MALKNAAGTAWDRLHVQSNRVGACGDTTDELFFGFQISFRQIVNSFISEQFNITCKGMVLSRNLVLLFVT